MINNIVYVHEECCISQINIKLLSLNEEDENFDKLETQYVLRSLQVGGGGGYN